MNYPPKTPPKSGHLRVKTMELFIPVVFLVAWIILQAWVLPRFGVKT
jgi:hypothetical protein